MFLRGMAFALGLVLSMHPIVVQASDRVLVQSTTSTQNSGLYDHLLPLFEEKSGVRVDIVAVGTGQAIRNASNGDADVLLVHSRDAEEAFVAEGNGLARHDLMYNDFVVIGPAEDPLALSNADTLQEALVGLGSGDAIVVSRGDDSGTHKKEIALWQGAGRDPLSFGSWYRETGSGMGATLRVAIEMGAYTLTDRATWLTFKSKGSHRIAFDGAPELFNQYGVIILNPEKFPHINLKSAQAFVDWMLGPEGQQAIAAYQLDGQQLFFPNAALPD